MTSLLLWAQVQAPSLGWLTTKLLRLTLSSAEWVLWLLVALSVASFAVMLERAVFFGSQRLRNADALADWLAHGELERAEKALVGQTGMEAVVVREMLLAAPQGADTVEEVLLSVLARERARYERGLSFLGTLGSNAPFVGLFGTVLGIIKAFNDLGAVAVKGSAIQQTVMAGISEALVATAVGLGVAIPAVVAYNAFTRWLKTLVNRSQALGYALVGAMRARAEGVPTEKPAPSLAQGR
jgi:biopolymer transport protein ExbB